MNYNDYWNIWCAMRLVKDYAGQAMNPACERWGVTPVQVCLLMSLHFEGPQPAGCLARTCGMAGANASVLCKRLEGMGLLARRRHPQDERLVIVSLTPKGTEVVETILEDVSGYFDRPPGEMDGRDVETIKSGIGQLNALLRQNTAGQAAMEEKIE